MAFRRRSSPFTLLADGAIGVELEGDARALLASLPLQLSELMTQRPDDPGLARLSPPAYVSNAEAEAEYKRYTGDDLADRRRAQLEQLATTAGATRLDAAQADAWLTALNALRLYLGTTLDVSEETEAEDYADEHDRAAFALLHYLGGLQDLLLSAVAEGFPPPSVSEGGV